MKKFIFILFALAGMAGTVSAQTLTVSDVYAKQGETVVATLNYACPADTYTGMKITLQFPSAGFTVAEAITEAGNEYTAIEGSIKNIEYSLGEGSVTYTAASSGAFSSATINVEFTVGTGVALSETGYEVSVSGQLEGPNSAKAAINGSFKVFVNDYITLDENSTVAPKATSTASNVKVKRTLKAGEWSTIVLPFALNKGKAEDAFGTDMQLAQLDGFTTTFASEDDFTPVSILINFKDYSLGGLNTMKAGTPYLIKVSKNISEFMVENVTIADKINEKSVGDTNYSDALSGKMTGSFVAGTIPADGFFISNNQFWYSTGKTNVKGFRCWFEFDPVLGKEFAASRIKFSVDDELTNVEGFATQPIQDGEYYDLKGQRVETPSKGIYIKDGKKVVVK